MSKITVQCKRLYIQVAWLQSEHAKERSEQIALTFQNRPTDVLPASKTESAAKNNDQLLSLRG